MPISDWNQWDPYHSDPEQLSRQERALDKKITPLSVNSDDCSGTFKGSGSSNYETSLCGCTCVDFVRRLLPCKHMYRLAHELHVLSLGEVQIASVPMLNSNEAFQLIQNSLDPDEQRSFSELCYHFKDNNDCLCDSKFADKLISLDLAQEITDVPTILRYFKMSDLRQFLPDGVKSPRSKSALADLVATYIKPDEIDMHDQKCICLHPRIAHLAVSLRRKLLALYPEEPTFNFY